MKKSDLKTGMLVEAANGNLSLVMLGTPQGDVLVGDGKTFSRSWCPLSAVNVDLTRSSSEDDIVRVYSFSNNRDGASFNQKCEDRELLWERKVSKMTLTSEYEAIVDYEKEVVKVGCQTIPFSKVQELYDVVNKR